MYLIDSNILINAKNHYYDFQVCPGFWNWIKKESNNGNVGSITPVKSEINDGDETDALKLWINDGSPLEFYTPDEGTVTAMTKVTDWVLSQSYHEKHIAHFLSKADPLIIAYAAAHDHTVVTHEIYAPNDSKKVKIPNVCEAMGVDYMNTFDMLKKEQAVFNLIP